MIRFAVLVLAVVALAACSDKKKAEGLPPAQEWGANAGGTVPPVQQQGPTPPSNPHGANPHGGMDPNDPHAGVDMNNPHGGGGGGGDPAMALPSPDPDRPIDPTHHVKGTIRVHPKAASRAPLGGAIFLVVKRAGDDGTPQGPPLAVEKLTLDKDELPFELSEKNAMIAGTQLTGEVVVIARYDHDGDAISHQPGDVVGQIRVKIPADNVKLTLDDVLQ